MPPPGAGLPSVDRGLTVETPLLERMAPSPMWLSNPSDERLVEEELSAVTKTTFPSHAFTLAKKDKSGKRVPQAIAHRGYKAKFPENTLGAFKGAVKVGAQAIETDVHLSKDGVVVLSHDADLKRCFGESGKIIDHDWAYLKNLRTLKEPHEPMPRLLDLIEYLTEPGLEDVWLLLDIKLDNNSDDVMRLIGETINSVAAVDKRPWNQRIVLGIWAAKYLPLCEEYLPSFPVAYIGFSLYCASKFFAVPGVAFNMLHHVLRSPCGSRFVAKAKRLHRPVYAWTVNDAKAMRWGIRKGIDGIVTDDPKKYLEVRDSYHEGITEEFSTLELFRLIYINILAIIFGFLFNFKYGLGDIPEQFGGKAHHLA